MIHINSVNWGRNLLDFSAILVDLVLREHLFMAPYRHTVHLGGFTVSGNIIRIPSAERRRIFLMSSVLGSSAIVLALSVGYWRLSALLPV